MTSHDVPRGRPPILASLLLSACAASPSTAVEPPAPEQPRHAELVETQVLRSVGGQPREALDHAKEFAVVETARALDPLEPAEVGALRLDVSLTLVSESPAQLKVRALVAVNLAGPPERMRAMLQGTGTVQRGTDRLADLRLAAEGAVRAALRRLLQVTRTVS